MSDWDVVGDIADSDPELTEEERLVLRLGRLRLSQRLAAKAKAKADAGVSSSSTSTSSAAAARGTAAVSASPPADAAPEPRVVIGQQFMRVPPPVRVTQPAAAQQEGESSSSAAPAASQSSGHTIAGEWSARIERAQFAGEQAARKLDGQARVLPTPPIIECAASLDNRCYIVLRSAEDPLGGVRAIWRALSWRSASQFVLDRETRLQDPLSVHHAFPSLREGRAYWQAAGFPGEPPPLP